MTDLSKAAQELAASEATRTLLELALSEDIGAGDVTTQASIPEGAQATARIVARQDGVVCGFPVLQKLIELSGGGLTLEDCAAEGASLKTGDIMGRLRGRADLILTLERTMLNILQRMSGIATITRRYVDAVAGTNAKILETRKTIPGWRGLDKYAVLAGGASNHRLGLFDQILAKENHFALIEEDKFEAKLKSLKTKAKPGITIQVEVESLEELRAALSQNIELVLLDNMSPDDMRQAVAMRDAIAGCNTKLEASGGITLENIHAAAQTGVDRISIGALTHSVPAFDLSLLVDF